MKNEKAQWRVNNGELFVVLAHVMNPLCATIDGVPQSFFKDSRRTWVQATIARKWLEREIEGCGEDQQRYRRELQTKLDIVDEAIQHVEAQAS